MSRDHLQNKAQLSDSVNKAKLKMSNRSVWGKLVRDIVRPSRFTYKMSDTVPPSFYINDCFYMRQDLTVLCSSKKIEVSLYKPDYKNNWIVLYLHGNSASKLEGNSLLKYLPFGFSLAAFDFFGCGMNMEEDTVSLGCRESQQVQAVVEELESRSYNVILWGRSMGAATALKYGKAQLIIADSAFSSFRQLCKKVAVRRSPRYVPSCLISCILPCVFYKLRQDIKKEGDYDIQALDIVADVKKIDKNTCIIFMSGEEDTLIDKTHSQTLFKAFNGNNKILQIFPGSHNTRRPDSIMHKIMNKIQVFVSQKEEVASSSTLLQSNPSNELNEEQS